MTNQLQKTGLKCAVLSVLALGAAGQVWAAERISVSSGGTGVITLSNSDDVLMIAGGESSGELTYVLNSSEPEVLSNVKRLTINGLGGNYEISVIGVELAQNLIISTQNGEDSIELMSSTIGGRLSIVSGPADDELVINNSTVGGAMWINSGSGSDQVMIEGVIAESRFQLVTRSGDDVISIVPGEQSAELQDFARVNTGIGEDSLLMDGVSVTRQMGIATGFGMDSVTLNANTFNDRLTVNTGAQDDELIATSNTSALRTELNGAAGGADVYRQDELNAFGSPMVFRGFEIEEMVETEVTYAIGDTGPGGGIVFEVSEDGMSGLEAAPSDQSSGVVWCDTFTDIAGVDNLADSATPDRNSGAVNTPLIAAACSSSAADVAADYVLNGVDDWFLPNKEELDLLLNQISNANGFSGDILWSSSEFDTNAAWGQAGSNLPQIDFSKDGGRRLDTLRVRAVRAF